MSVQRKLERRLGGSLSNGTQDLLRVPLDYVVFPQTNSVGHRISQDLFGRRGFLNIAKYTHACRLCTGSWFWLHVIDGSRRIYVHAAAAELHLMVVVVALASRNTGLTLA